MRARNAIFFNAFLTLHPSQNDIYGLDSYYYTFTAESHEDCRWDKVFDCLKNYFRTTPKTFAYVRAARALAYVESPAEAARYLEKYRSNTYMADSPNTFLELGHLYLMAENWKKARLNLKKFLKWPCSDGMRKWVEERIQECGTRLGQE